MNVDDIGVLHGPPQDREQRWSEERVRDVPAPLEEVPRRDADDVHACTIFFRGRPRPARDDRHGMPLPSQLPPNLLDQNLDAAGMRERVVGNEKDIQLPHADNRITERAGNTR